MLRKILARRKMKVKANMNRYRRVFSRIHRILTSHHLHQVYRLNSDTSHSTFSLHCWIEALCWVTNQIHMAREWINFTKSQHQWFTILSLSLREAKVETFSITLPILRVKVSLWCLKCNSCSLIMNSYKQAVLCLNWATCTLIMECQRTFTMTTTTNQQQYKIIK